MNLGDVDFDTKASMSQSYRSFDEYEQSVLQIFQYHLQSSLLQNREQESLADPRGDVPPLPCTIVRQSNDKQLECVRHHNGRMTECFQAFPAENMFLPKCCVMVWHDY